MPISRNKKDLGRMTENLPITDQFMTISRCAKRWKSRENDLNDFREPIQRKKDPFF